MPKYFGAHVSSAGGLPNALTAAQALGVNTIQIHASPPQRWVSKPIAPGVETEFNPAKREAGVEKIFFHGIYLINLASPDPQKLHMAKLSLVHYLELLSRIKGEGVIFHLGSMKDQENESVGHAQCAEAIGWVLERTPPDSRLILEVAAGSGKVIGDRLEDLARIYEQVTEQSRVGFGLDTQHLWASGYDLQNELDGFVAEVGSVLGFDKVWSIHLNDSKTERGSRRDRHENLGDGLIGADALRSFFNHPKFEEIPFILETPGLKTPEGALAEIEKLRAW